MKTELLNLWNSNILINTLQTDYVVNNMPKLGLITFMFYLPIFLLLLFLAFRKYKRYSFSSFWLSDLGDTRSPGSIFFNIAIFLFGLLGIFFVRGLARIMPNLISANISLFFLYLSSVSSIVLSFAPMNKNLDLHHIFATMTFLGLAIASLFSVLPIFYLGLFPKYLLLLNGAIFLLSFLMFVAFRKFVINYGNILDTLSKIREKEKSFLVRNVGRLELILILTVIMWSSIMSITALQNIK